MKLKDFKCTQCGECCRHLEKIKDAEYLIINGVCKYLKDNLCTIYDNRPWFCNRYKVYEKLKDTISEDEFLKITIDACEKLKKEKK